MLQETVRNQHRKWQEPVNAHAHTRSFQPGDRIMSRNFAAGPNWMPGVVLACEGKMMVKIKLDDGRVWRRHVNQILKSQVFVGTDASGQYS